MSIIEKFLSSELSRNSARVFKAAEQHPVLVTRRDGENLILMSENDDRARKELFELGAQLISIATDSQGTLEERMMKLFPWMYALTGADRTTCTQDLIKAAAASFSTGQASLIVMELTSWRETATALAEGLNSDSPDWFKVPKLVSSP
jgi:hypothetical protein